MMLAMASLSISGPSSAFTAEEIDAAAEVARDIDIVETIADDVYEGRETGTSGSTAVQGLLIDELKLVSDGLNTAETGDDAYRQPFSTSLTGTNLLGVIPGTDLASEYVMIGAHYDHLGLCGAPGEICNGATDNAAGVAIVLAVGAALDSLPTPPRRSVILALWDAEEWGLIGSLAYVNSPLVSLSATKAYINVDLLGANLLPSLRDLSFAVGAESGGAALQTIVANAIAEEDLGMRLFSRAGGQDRSDHHNFIDVIPTVYFGDGTGACYHTPEDESTVVDLEKLREQSQIAFRVALELAETSTPPAWVQTAFPPFFPIGTAVYEDAVLVRDLLDGALTDKHLFPVLHQTTLQTHRDNVDAIVSTGPVGFTCSTTCFETLADALQFAEFAMQSLPCDPFGPLELAKTSSPSPVAPLQQLTYSITVENVGSRDEPLALISDAFDQTSTAYVSGSASDGGSESGGVVSWPAVSVAAASSVVRTFSVEADASLDGLPAASRFSDDVESGGSLWTVSHGSGTDDWSIKNTDTARPDSGSSSWFAENVDVESDQYLTLASPYAVPATGATLAFHHYYEFEGRGTTHHDGGVVEISTDGTIWSDLGPHAIENPYDGNIACCGNPLGTGTSAFTGSSGGYIRSRFDLTPYAGSSVWIRFRLGTDSSGAQHGWWIDDIEIGELVVNDAQVDAGGAAHASVRHTTQVPEPSLPLLLISGIVGLAVLGRARHRA